MSHHVTFYEQDHEYTQYILVKPLRLAKLLVKGYKLVASVEYETTVWSSNTESHVTKRVVRLMMGKGTPPHPRIKLKDLDRLPVLRLPDYQDPAEIVKEVQDPETLIGILQHLVINLTTPKPTDTDTDRAIRAVGTEMGHTLAKELGLSRSEPVKPPVELPATPNEIAEQQQTPPTKTDWQNRLAVKVTEAKQRAEIEAKIAEAATHAAEKIVDEVVNRKTNGEAEETSETTSDAKTEQPSLTLTE